MTFSAHPAGSSWLTAGEQDLPDGTGWLSEREAAYAVAMVFTKRRTEYLLRRWAGKQAVAAAVGLETAPSALAPIEVGNRPSGAPLVLVDGGRPASTSR